MAKSRNYLIPFVVFLVLSVLLFFVILLIAPYLNTSTSTEYGKAMVHVEVHSWGYNEENTSELIFDYWISNFGDYEAKDVVVKCNLDDVDGNKVFSASKSFGNIASRSIELAEMTPAKTSAIDFEEGYSSYCYVESCDDCDILYKRIPQIYQSFQ